LDATGAWVARSFLEGMTSWRDMTPAVLAARRRLDEWAAAHSEDLECARVKLAGHAVNWQQASLLLRG
jgi:hypothetical protein